MQNNLLDIIYRTMTKEIKQIVFSILKDSMIASSWGISNIRMTCDSVIFSVEAMKYKGDVTIKTTFDKKCIVTFGNGIEMSCTYDKLVNIIDTKIEYSENYVEEVEKWLYIKNTIG